jgi:outer membrane protein insertion porin family
MNPYINFRLSTLPLAVILSSSFSIFLSIPSLAQELKTDQAANSPSTNVQSTNVQSTKVQNNQSASLSTNATPSESLNQSQPAPNISPPIAPASTVASDLLPKSASDTIQFDGMLPISLIADNTQQINEVEEAKDKQKPFSLYFGSRLPDPSVLRGPTREPVVPASQNIDGGASISAGAQVNLSKPLKLFLEFKGGESVLAGDASLFYGSDDLRKGVAVNIFTQQAFSPSFVGGTDVNLPNGRTPWVDRNGGGVEVRHPFGKYFDSSVGITYQSIAVRDSIFGSKRQPVDQFGNKLTVSPSGRDDLLTLNLALQYDNRDDAKRPTRGTHLRFGLDQSLPSGNGAIAMTRLSASASQFFPVPFFGKKKSTFVVNVQGGRILGDVPPYEAFSLGGSDTVRGYDTGRIGTGSSFVQASAEYRFPLFDLKVFKQPIGVGGALFVDYGSLLGTQNEVIGQPGIARNKPGDGFGYGAGLSFDTRFGVARIDAGINDQGDAQVHASLSERF